MPLGHSLGAICARIAMPSSSWTEDNAGCQMFFIADMVIFGAFAMATPVGIAALVASIVCTIGAVLHAGSHLEICQRKFNKHLNWK